MTGETSSTIDDAQNKCKKISAKLPFNKSESERTFILGLMNKKKSWVWLGMKKKQGKKVWFDNKPAEPSDGALCSAWNANEQSKHTCNSMIERGIKTGATIPHLWVPLSFAKKSSCNMDIGIRECIKLKSQCPNYKL